MRDLSAPDICGLYDVLMPNEPIPIYDAYFTWHGHEVRSGYDPESVTYIYNGEEMGRGKAAFRKMISKLEKLPPNSKVLVYPHYVVGTGSLSYPLYYPFDDYWSLLDDVARRKQLTVIFSSGNRNRIK